MKKWFIFLLFSIPGYFVVAQETSAEAEIRKLEEQERQAVLRKDTANLRKIWDRYLIVNAPSNRVVLSGEDAVARPVITQMTYSSFTREIEQILVRGDVVLSMGSEIIIPGGEDDPRKGKEIKRRYTNMWMKQGGVWKLVARHANEICQ